MKDGEGRRHLRLPVFPSIKVSKETLQHSFVLQHQELTLLKIKYDKITMVKSRDEGEAGSEFAFELDLPIVDPDFPFDITSLHLLIVLPLTYPEHLPPKILLKDKHVPNAISTKIQHYLDKELSQASAHSVLAFLPVIQEKLEEWAMALDPFAGNFVKLIPAKDVSVSGPSVSKGTKEQDQKQEQELIQQLNALQPTNNCSGLEWGTAIWFTKVTLSHIAMLKLVSLRLQVVCHRCRCSFSLPPIRPLPEKNDASICCPRCKAFMDMLLFEAKNLFPTSIVDPIVAIVQVKKAQIVDLLVSDYKVTCSECDESETGQMILKTARGQMHYLTCPKCRSSLCAHIQQVDFKPFPDRHASLTTPVISCKKKPAFFVATPGKPLPEYGACKHYKKSFRWLRFPCCGGAFACDQCHELDTKENLHEMQWATRMICGFCSKEQPFSQIKPCGNCGKSLSTAGQKKSTFWEGGKGSRDSTTMSRKDAKKYKLLNRS